MSAGDAGLPRAARILRPADFARVYGHRQSAAAGPLVVYAAANDLPDGRTRLGLSVSRRIGNAVVRNAWKRRLREAFRHRTSALPVGTDLIVVVRGGPAPAGAAGAREIAELLVTLVGRVTSRRGYAAARRESQGPQPGTRRAGRGRKR